MSHLIFFKFDNSPKTQENETFSVIFKHCEYV